MSRQGVWKVAGVVLLVVGGFLLPFSTLGTANVALINALVAVSLVVLTGWVGQISLAQAAFVGMGAFSTALAVRSFGLAFPVTIAVGSLAAMASAALLGVVALRVRGLYLAVATLIFAWMAQGYLFNLPELVGSGGSSIANTPPLGEEGSVPYLNFGDRRTYYFVLLAAVGGAMLAMANLRDSKTGRSYFAVKGSEIAAASLGIDVTRAKLSAFAVSGFLAGLAGSLVITHQGIAAASQFTVEQSLFYLSVAVVGGLTSLGGALASGALFASLEEIFREVEALAGFLLLTSAALLAAVLLFFPAGLAGIPGRLASIARRLGVAEFAARTRSVYRQLRARTRGGEAHDAATDGGPDEPDVDLDERDDPVDEVGDDQAEAPDEGAASPPRTPGDPLRRAVKAFGAAVARRFGRPRRRQATAPSTDALLASLAEEEERVAAEAAARRADPEGLVYAPGTAKRPKLPARAKRAPVLAARDITVQFGGLTAVNAYDLEVREGEITALIGPNGAGKTTLFNAISGLNQPTSGTVHVFGHDVSEFPVHERARLGVGRTFQVLQLFPELSVFENLMVATHQRNPTGFFSHLAATSGSVDWEAASRERVRQVVELIGLHDEANRQVAGLPFGRLRLVELARALVTGSPFVMLDEPASGLDNAETDRFMDLLLWVRERLGVTMLLIEHDMRVVMGLADYVYVIDRGTKVSEGTTKKIQKDKKVIAAYLGTAPADVDDDDADAQDQGAEAPVEAAVVDADGGGGANGGRRRARRTAAAGSRR